MQYLDINEVEITKAEFDDLVVLGGVGVVILPNIKLLTPLGEIVDTSARDSAAKAKFYLEATDFKALSGTLTAEQTDRRTAAKLVLEGTFVEPDYNF
jgi:hypothetical protein